MRIRSALTAGLSIAVTIGIVFVTSASAGPPPDFSAPNGQPAGGVSALAVSPAVVESVFVPLQPCRILDTRSAVGRFNSGTSRSIQIRGTSGFVQQGGRSGGCGVPPAATGVTTAVTTTQSSAGGYLVGWPFGKPEPTANFATYNRNQGMTVGADFALRGPGSEPSLVLRNFGGPTHVIVDVTGYYAPQLSGFVEQNGTLVFSSGRITTVSHPSTGNYLITFDRNVSQCTFQVTPFGYNWVTAVGPVGTNQAQVYIHDQVAPFLQHDTSFHILAVC